MKICVMSECESRHYARGFCKSHYERLRRYGEPDGRYIPNSERICSVDSCDIVVASSGLCNAHYQRTRNGTDLAKPIGRAWREYPYETVNIRGYVDIVYGRELSQRKAKHRVVMEEVLGRPLESNESVHHIDGDKTNNHPDNLELWSTSQPYGQRVSDKIRWAKQILETYGDDDSEF